MRGKGKMRFEIVCVLHRFYRENQVGEKDRDR